jgi:hemerythrin superfamily protein
VSGTGSTKAQRGFDRRILGGQLLFGLFRAGYSDAGPSHFIRGTPMTTSIENGQDAIDFLIAQHSRIRRLFETIVSVDSMAAREEAFVELRRLLAVHETAEEQIVHPRARREIEDGERIVGERLEEENSAKKMLADVENTNLDSEEFISKITTLRKAVLDHAEHEETDEFPALASELSEDELKKMRSMIKKVEAMAPTRPHPGIESATANTLTGPFASMLDRARDALSNHF